jgi:4-amino-4-deoxy-L-arabinose transferase-like glycosyltransferase
MRVKLDNKKLLYLVLFIAFAVKSLTTIIIFDNNKYYWEDTIHYYSAAESFVETGSFGQDAEEPEMPFSLEPLYSVVISPFTFISNNTYLYIRLFQNLIIVLSGLVFFRLMKFFTNEKFAIIGTIFYLAYPFYVYLSGSILPEPVLIVLLVLFIYFVMDYIKNGKLLNYLTLCVLYTMLIHLKVATGLLGFFLLIPFVRNINYYQRVKTILIGTFVIVLLSLPWGIRNYNVKGVISLPRSAGGQDESEIENRYENMFADTSPLIFFGDNITSYFSPALTKVDSVNKFNKPFYNLVGIIVSLPLILTLLFIPFFFRRYKRLWVLYLFLVLYSLPYIIFQGQTRYRLPIDFVMIIFLTVIIENFYTKYQLISNQRNKVNN